MKLETPKQRLDRLRRYKVRTCLYLNECCLCGKAITAGQQYHDGGYSRRAHVKCVEEEMP